MAIIHELVTSFSLPLVLVSVSVISLLAKAVYNVYIHPLRVYPGPKLWAATHICWIYYRVTGQLVWKSVELHRQYGIVVRVAPDQLSYTTDTAWKSIYGHRPVEMQKNCLAGFSRPGLKGVHAILSADQANHARLRRVLAPAFSESVLRDQDPIVMKYADILMEKLASKANGGPLDLNKWFEWVLSLPLLSTEELIIQTTLDQISDVVCREPAMALVRESGSPWLEVLTSSIQSQVWHQALELYGLARWRKYLLPMHIVDAAMENFRIASAKVDSRLARNYDCKDHFSYILRHNDEKGVTETELKLNTATIIGSGTGTTTSWLSTTVYSVTRNRQAYRRLAGEIRNSFERDEDITPERVTRLPYLAAVMKESLRIHPPSPSSLGRLVPEGGEMIDGRFVPAGTTVGVHQYAANHLPLNFYRADDYCPERWLPSGRDPTSPFAADRLEAMQPFSYGPRACMGMKLSHVEVRMILAKLFWHFDVELAGEAKEWQGTAKGTVAWHRTAMMCELRRMG